MEQRLQKVNQDGLIETAKETGIDPFRYLTWVLESDPQLDCTVESWAVYCSWLVRLCLAELHNSFELADLTFTFISVFRISNLMVYAEQPTAQPELTAINTAFTAKVANSALVVAHLFAQFSFHKAVKYYVS